MLNLAANFIKHCKPEETIIIYHGGCADGICAAAILLKTFQKLFGTMPKAKFSSPGTIKKLNLHYQKIIFIDLAVDQEKNFLLELKKKSDILIIDHHQISTNLNKENILHINPEIFSKIKGVQYPASKLIFDICSHLINIDNLDWIVAIGLIHDVSAEYWKSFMNKTFTKYPELGKVTYTYEGKIGFLVSIITAGQDLKNGNELALKVLLEAERPSDILDAKIPEVEDLLEINKKRTEELNYYLENWEKLANYDKKLKLVIYDVNLKYKIASALSTALAKKHPDLLFIVLNKESPSVLKINFRQTLEKIDCAWLAKVSTEPFGGSGGGHCLGKDMLVQLKSGELVKIADVAVGDKLESIDFKENKIANSLCLQTFTNSRIKKIYEISTEYGFKLIASPEHKVFSVKNYNVVESSVKDLKIGDFIAVAEATNPETHIQKTPNVRDIILRAKTIGHRWKKVRIPKTLTPELAQILGYLVGDGNIYANDQVEFRDQRKEVLEYYRALIKRVFSCNSKISKIKDKNCWRLRLFNLTVATFLKRLRSDLKIVEKSPNDVVAAFLRGVFDAKCYADPLEVGLSMKDEIFVTKLQLLLLRFGIHATKMQRQTMSRLSLRGENLKRFVYFIGLTSKEKLNKIKNFKSTVTRQIPVNWQDVINSLAQHKFKLSTDLIHADRRISYLEWARVRKLLPEVSFVKSIDSLFNFFWVRIKTKKLLNNSNTLYDLTTTHGNYLANGIIVHNSPAAGGRIHPKFKEQFKARVRELLQKWLKSERI